MLTVLLLGTPQLMLTHGPLEGLRPKHRAVFYYLADPVVGDDLHNAPQSLPDMQKMLGLANQYGLIFGRPKQ